MIKIPIVKEFENDQWVKPYFKQYRKSLLLALLLGFLTFLQPVP